MSNEEAVKKASGLRPPEEPPHDADAFDVAMHYLRHWENEFLRTRLVVKNRASSVVITVAIATALIAVVSAATAITGWSSLGILTAGLAGVASVVSAWDGLFRHRELWLQRSLVLSRLQQIHRRAVFELALKPQERSRVASEVNAAVDDVLSQDQMSWSELRTKNSSGQKEVPSG